MRLDRAFRLAFECPLRWEKLLGDDKQRYCASCEKHVTNLSAMSRHQAEAFLAATEAPICVRVEVDEKDEPVFRPALAGLALAGSLVAGAGVVQATGLNEPTMITASPCVLASAPDSSSVFNPWETEATPSPSPPTIEEAPVVEVPVIEVPVVEVPDIKVPIAPRPVKERPVKETPDLLEKVGRMVRPIELPVREMVGEPPVREIMGDIGPEPRAIMGGVSAPPVSAPPVAPPSGPTEP